AAIDVADPSHKADFLYRLRFAGPRKHVANLTDRTFGLLPGVVDLLTKSLPGLVLQGACISANEILCLSCEDLAIADIPAEWVEIAILEAAFAVDEHVDSLGLVGLHGGDCLYEHGFGFFRRAEFGLRKCRSAKRHSSTGNCGKDEIATHRF